MIIYEIERNIGGTIHEDILMNRLDKLIKPINNDFFGFEYHVSVTLYDKTFLPCVVFRHLGKAIELQFNSLHEKVYRGITNRKLLPQDYVQKEIIERIISNNNIISLSDIDKIETCKYSFPEEFRKKSVLILHIIFLSNLVMAVLKTFGALKLDFMKFLLTKNLKILLRYIIQH